MDLLAALALMLAIEGLAIALLAADLPRLLEQIRAVGPDTLRWTGLVMVGIGTGLYLVIRS